jgi:putative polyketide hydroxylase
MTVEKTSVLIIGAGYAGLVAALLLARRGVSCVLVERRQRLSAHPRAHGVNLRSMELLRCVPGLEDDLHRACRAAPGDNTIFVAPTVAGPRTRTLGAPEGLDTRPLSPAQMSSAGQDRVEPVLLRHARAQGADIRFGTELVDFSQDAQGVRATLRDVATGAAKTLDAAFLLAGDGCGSGVRKALGVAMLGEEAISHAVSILFRADLRAATAGRGFVLCYLQNPAFTGAFVSCDDADCGQLNIEYDAARDSAEAFDTPRCEAIVRAALGRPDLEVAILETQPWRMSALIAERMRVGRVFLLGDAAHVMPPVGGFAGQAAIQDAGDLAWKMAMTLRGDADAALLETYETERRPVAQLAIARATDNYVDRLRGDRAGLAPVGARENYLDVAMSYRYRSAAIAQEEPDDERPVDDVFNPSGRPGTRIAHISLMRDGAAVSTLDLVGDDFVVLAGPAAARWTAAAHAAQRVRPGLQLYRIGVDLVDCDGSFLRRTGLQPDGALLLRPDGFIAWRAISDRPDAAQQLAVALAQAACRSTRETHGCSRLRATEVSHI